MTTVYLDPSGTILARSPGRIVGEEHTRLLPGAVDAVARLRQEHYDVVVLSDGPIEPLTALGDGVRFDPNAPEELPAEPERPKHGGPTARSWLISADDGWSGRLRPAGLRTIRVGPRKADSRRPTARFDIEARDLTAAVLEILVQDTLET